MSEPGTQPTARLAAARSLTNEEIALLELYQRQDSLSTQLWQHFLLANMAVVLLTVLITVAFRDSAPVFAVPLPWLLSIPVFGVWATFTYGGLSAIRNSQKVLRALAHQIEGDVGDKTDLFVNVTRSDLGVKCFHIAVDVCIFGLCLLLIARAQFPREMAAPAAAVVIPSSGK